MHDFTLRRLSLCTHSLRREVSQIVPVESELQVAVQPGSCYCFESILDNQYPLVIKESVQEQKGCIISEILPSSWISPKCAVWSLDSHRSYLIIDVNISVRYCVECDIILTRDCHLNFNRQPLQPFLPMFPPTFESPFNLDI